MVNAQGFKSRITSFCPGFINFTSYMTQVSDFNSLTLSLFIYRMDVVISNFGIHQYESLINNSSGTTIDKMGFPGGSDGKEYAHNLGDLYLIPGSGRSPGGRHGGPLQYSCLENSMDRRAWWATVHGVSKS